MTEIARRPAGDLADKMQYAQALASASLLPAAYRKQPGNVLLAVEVGESLGLSAITAINNINIIDGKPSASAALVSALVRRAGHRLRVIGNDTRAVAEIVRSDDPEFTYRAEWDVGRAKTAGLLAKGGAWNTYRAAMLKARAVTEVARDACQEVLSGLVQYSAEELGAVVDEAGQPLTLDPPAGSPVARIVDASLDAADLDTLRALWREADDARLLDEPVVDETTGLVVALRQHLRDLMAAVDAGEQADDDVVDVPLPDAEP